MGDKNKGIEAYNSVCEKVPKLCPRLVPSPLWCLSLANLAKIDPREALVLSDDYPTLIEKIKKWWFSLPRKGRCEVCGGKGSVRDEEWLYFVLDEKGESVLIDMVEEAEIESFEGLAYLSAIRLLCPRCNLAKHQGYALTQGREAEALEQFRKVNGIMSLDEARKLVEHAFVIYELLSEIKKWKIEIGELEGLDEETRKGIQGLLNHMYSLGFRPRGCHNLG